MRVIDKDKLIKEVEAVSTIYGKKLFNFEDRKKIIKLIEYQTEIDVANLKNGFWIETGVKNVYGGKQIKCSECGFSLIVSPEHFEKLSYYEAYCCHCGCKMDGLKWEDC